MDLSYFDSLFKHADDFIASLDERALRQFGMSNVVHNYNFFRSKIKLARRNFSDYQSTLKYYDKLSNKDKKELSATFRPIVYQAKRELDNIRHNYWHTRAREENRTFAIEVLDFFENFYEQFAEGLKSFQGGLYEQNKTTKKGKLNELSNLAYYQLIEKANRQFKVYKMSWANFDDKQVYQLGGPGIYKLQAMIYGGNGPVYAVDYNEEYYLTFLPAYDPSKFKESSMLFEFIEKTEAEGEPVSKYTNASWEKYSGYNFTVEYLQSKGHGEDVIRGAQGYGIELNENKNKGKNMKPIMEFTAKDFKKMLNNKKPVVVEQLTVGQFKKKIKEGREVMRLGLGFEDPNVTPKKTKNKPYKRAVGK